MADQEMRTDAELLTAARKDPVAFGEFYSRQAEELFRWFLSRASDRDVAVELTMETFARALASLGRFRPGAAGSGSAWLYGIGRHVLSDSYRRRRVETRARRRLGIRLGAEAESGLDGAVERLDARARRAWLADALDLLSEEQRAVVGMRAVNDMGYAEIGRALGCSDVAARNRFARAVRTLRSRAPREE